jgi:hypothetical protein
MSAAGGDTDLLHVKNGTTASQCSINRPPVKRSVDEYLEKASSPVLSGRRHISINSGLDLFDLFMELGAVYLIATMIRKGIPYFSKTEAKARRSGARITRHKPDTDALLQARSSLWQPMDEPRFRNCKCCTRRNRDQDKPFSLSDMNSNTGSIYHRVVTSYALAGKSIHTLDRFKHMILEPLDDDAFSEELGELFNSAIDIKRIERNFARPLTAYNMNLDRANESTYSRETSSLMRKLRPFRYLTDFHLDDITRHCVLFCESQLKRDQEAKSNSSCLHYPFTGDSRIIKDMMDPRRAQLVCHIFEDLITERSERDSRLNTKVIPMSLLPHAEGTVDTVSWSSKERCDAIRKKSSTILTPRAGRDEVVSVANRTTLLANRTTSLANRIASHLCRECACQREYDWKSSLPIATSGQLSIRFRNVPLLGPRCDNCSCRWTLFGLLYSFHADYWFPISWSPRMISVDVTTTSYSSPRISLRVYRIVPDSADAVLFALEGNIEGLKDLFTKGSASPHDISKTHGYSLLQVRVYPFLCSRSVA